VFNITGTVNDNHGTPLKDVIISDGAGDTAITGADGSYQFANLLASETPYFITPIEGRIYLCASWADGDSGWKQDKH